MSSQSKREPADGAPRTHRSDERGETVQSEQRYRALFDTMVEGFALYEVLCDDAGRPYDYRFLDVNPAFERLTGLKAADLIDRTVREVLPSIESVWIERYGRIALTGKPEQFEERSAALDRWYHVHAFLTAPGHLAVVFADITERKRAEQALREAHERLQLQAEELQTANEELHASNEELRQQELILRESEERFRATYEHAAIGIELLSLDGWLLRGNDTLSRILGYSHRELRRRRFTDITHPEDWPREKPLLDDLLAGRIPNYTIEKRYLHKDGHSVWVRVTSSLARVAQPYRISVIEDITARIQAQEALRESEQRVRLKLESILSPHGDLGTLELADIIDTQAIQSLMEDFYRLAHIPMAIIDLKGRVLVGVGWQEICTKFHRVHPETCRYCIESDTQLTVGVAPGEFRLYKCKNHMWDMATPLVVADQHVGNLFSGQFFFEDEPLDHELFQAQARHYGFDEPGYRAALEAVPRLSRQAVDTGMAFLTKMARLISQLSYGNIKLARSQGQLLKLNRTLQALSNSRQALMHATEEAAYLQEVCRIVVQDCGHALVWIGYAEEDEAKSIRPVAYAGFEEGYLENLQVTWADTERGRGPTGTAIRTGRPTLCRNMLTDPNFALWREQALRRGYVSSIALPLLSDGRALGAITIYSREPDPFAPDEKDLLMELATDLAHGITTLRLRAAHARAEESLRDSEQRLRLALEGGRMGRWEWDVPNDAASWDERARELLGFEPHVPVSSRLFFRIIDSRDRDRVRQLVTDTLAGGENYLAEFRVNRANGETPWLSLRGKVIRDVQGQAVRMMGVLYDITQRKQMEADLRRLNDQLEEEVQAQTEELKDTVERLQGEVGRRLEAEESLRRRSQMLEAFFQHTIAPLAFLDREFTFVRVNEAYARADGKTPDYFPGKNHFTLYPHEENRRIFAQVVQTRQPYFARAKAFCYPDSPHRITYWDWQLTPLLDEHGAVQFLVLNLEDVTEQQTAFRELEQRARQLQKLTLEVSQAEDRERKRLAEILHDDLQQQLAAAKFHLSLLGRRVSRDPATQQAVAQLDQILKDAVEKSRSLSHELSPVVLYQSDLGESFEWLARQLQAKHGLTVDIESRGRINPASEALKVFLYRTAQEILFNVVKHARVRQARLRLQRMNGSVWLTISDQGQGFDPRALGQADGFGLLSIRERIELLGGRMKIRSVPGRGSTFLIAVPDSQRVVGSRTSVVGEENGPSDHRPPAPDRRLPATDYRQPLRVLLVDDHKVVRAGLASLLKEQADIEVVGQAGNGREAVDLAHQLRPDVVVMDVSMPVMSGEEATRQIKLHLPDIRIVALSMFEEADMADAMCRAGAAVYLLKTAPSDQLLAAIRG